MLVSRNSAEIKCAALYLVWNDSATAENAAPSDGWLTGLGILVVDRIFCILSSIGLAEGFQRFTLLRSGNKRSAQSTDLFWMCTCPVDRMSAAGSEALDCLVSGGTDSGLSGHLLVISVGLSARNARK